MSRKQGGHDTGTHDNLTLSFYLPDKLHEIVKSFARSSGKHVEDAYRDLLSKGLLAESAKHYFDLLLRRNSLRRSEAYSEYSRDGSILKGLVEQMKSENAEMKHLLLKKGLLKEIPEKLR